MPFFFHLIQVVMCWAGPQALSPLSSAHLSPSQTQPRQGLGVGLGLAWAFWSLSRRPRPRLTAIFVTVLSNFSSMFEMAIATFPAPVGWELVIREQCETLWLALCTWPQTSQHVTLLNLQHITCPLPHCATYLLLIVRPVCINQHEAQLCQIWGSKWSTIATLMFTFNVFSSFMAAFHNLYSNRWGDRSKHKFRWCNMSGHTIKITMPFSDCTLNCDALKWALFLWTWKNIDNMSIGTLIYSDSVVWVIY